ncbi:hypothetical protein ACFYSF_13125 [Streptomyces canus]|uniref:hypothetical protein n=1 Tax=Streptomyces canus TaxID=58343 RepID=UPI0036D03721
MKVDDPRLMVGRNFPDDGSMSTSLGGAVSESRAAVLHLRAQYVPDDGRQVRAMNGGELAKGLFGCYVAINPGSRANISIPSSELAVSAFG